jgi:bacteriorhodopsin
VRLCARAALLDACRVVGADIAMILTGLFGAYATGRSQWVSAQPLGSLPGSLPPGNARCFERRDELSKLPTWLSACVVKHPPHWPAASLQGWFLAGCAFLIVVMVGLLRNGAQRAYSRNEDVRTSVALMLLDVVRTVPTTAV